MTSIPAIICYLTPVKGNPLATVAKCGTSNELELLKAFQDLGFSPMVDSVTKNRVSKLRSTVNGIIYVWLPDEEIEDGKRSLNLNIMGIPSESLSDPRYLNNTKDEELCIAAVQYYNEPVTKTERMTIANHLIERMMGEDREKSDKVKALYERGFFDAPTLLRCSTVHDRMNLVIKPDSDSDIKTIESSA